MSPVDMKVQVEGDAEFNAKVDALTRALNRFGEQHDERMSMMRKTVASNIVTCVVVVVSLAVWLWVQH